MLVSIENLAVTFIMKFTLMKRYFELVLLIFVVGCISVSEVKQSDDPSYVILVSFDGFRHDYVEKFNAPNFKQMIGNGVAAESMLPSYPTKTFPNHYTIVTGLYPNNHGLVDNSFYDEETGLVYKISDRDKVENPVFYGGLPLWQLAQNNGLKSASYFWVGSEAPITGSFPDYYHRFDNDVSYETRIQGVIDWLKLPEEDRPHFISLYFELVDSQGHATGPNAPETGKTVLEADRLLGILRNEIAKLDLPIDLIVTSDHGMNEIPPVRESYISVTDLLKDMDRRKVKYVNNGAHGHFYFADKSYIPEVRQILEQRPDSARFEVFGKSEMPERWKYGKHDRIGDLFIKMNPGHYLTSMGRINTSVNHKLTRGEHGFDPHETKDLHTIFYAEGPSFKQNTTIDTFENVHIYPLIAEILGIRDLPEIDGKLEVLEPILKK